ncbi:D-mycarose 3-C-methyltransferase [Pseudolabrys sp. Root1462]|uniref:methyltransferase domain-containing protein n=1 Tax=Pseudolabrys sp. Root1462 TaxID=1736466 RepID=UPI0007031C2F|nr:methyltransferase domain-containing protein [Pseudolabrys sp. Root1462]KQZ01907.1 D-mycarose 3-C-methyltransferase [Pseudolabrys sp. Root1462]
MQEVFHRDTCRLCGSRSLELVLPILPSAIGDAFVPSSRLDEKQGTYSLETYLCLDCGHLQNIDTVNPDILFREYTYRTSVSLGLVEHFRKYAANVVENVQAPKGSLVVEIGSNDGSLLKAFKSHGMRVVGIDPARAIAETATAEGIPTIPEFFSTAIAERVVAEHGRATVFCANNVFAHIDDMADIVAGIRKVLADDGVFVFEVSYIFDMIDNMVFDTIYHEHVSHHALLPLEKFFNRFDMTLFDVEKQRSKGGSIRGFAQTLSTGKRTKSETLLALYEGEEKRQYRSPKVYRDFFDAIEARKVETLRIVDEVIAAGGVVAGYGASTTTTTLLYHFELEKRIKFIVDDNPIKQGMYSPGAHIPVLPSDVLKNMKPALVVILAWIYFEPIIKRNQSYLDQGGKFLVPLPEVNVVSKP